jgi:ligand-binding sensor domain-containing protein
VYRHDFDDPNSISSSNISCITEDPDGNLWIGTINGGVNKLDVASGKFIRFKQAKYQSNISDRSISGIVATKDRKIWAATYGYGLLCFNLEDNTIAWRLTESRQLNANDITRFYKDKRGNLWLGGTMA